jgi:hypothetical protein
MGRRVEEGGRRFVVSERFHWAVCGERCNSRRSLLPTAIQVLLHHTSLDQNQPDENATTTYEARCSWIGIQTCFFFCFDLCAGAKQPSHSNWVLLHSPQYRLDDVSSQISQGGAGRRIGL